MTTIVTITKVCNRCGEEKDITKFHRDPSIKKDGRKGECAVCSSISAKRRRDADPERRKRESKKSCEWSRTHKEERRAYTRRFKLAHPYRRKNQELLYRFGITIDDFNSMRLKQDYRCLICFKHEEALKYGLVVDHDHATGKVRGLLCNKCNIGLGHYEDNITLLQGAIKYLECTTSLVSALNPEEIL